MKLGMLTNLFVTFMTFAMVIGMPVTDRFICEKLGISPDDRLSRNPEADRYLHLRKIVLIFVFGVYVLLLSYVVFFSRSASDDYLVHVALYEDLANAVQIDYGIFGFIKDIFANGISSAMEHVRVNKIEDIYQVYLNIVLFIPMGYLLPYVFDFFRKDMNVRVLSACFITTLLIENIQLMAKLGFYDVDDIVSNMIGSVIGLRFYIWFAYVLADPDFRKENRRRRRYEHRAKQKALFPYLSKMSIERTTLYARDKKEVFDFYENKLGFRLKKAIPHGEDMDYLFELGEDQFEVRCSRNYKEDVLQEVTIACNDSEYLKKSLEEAGIKTSDYSSDPYDDLRTFSFKAPGNVQITVIEE